MNPATSPRNNQPQTIRRSRLGRALLRLSCFLLVILGMMPHVAAQDAAPVDNSIPLLSISDVNRILTDPSQTVPVTRRIRGTVIFTSRVGDFCIQQDQAGIMIEPPDPNLRPALGDLVEVVAPVAFHSADTLDPAFFFKVTTARIIAPGTVPDPVATKLPDALNGGTAGRWVEVEGVVMQSAIQNGVVRIHLTDDHGWAIVNVHQWRTGLSMRDWWGARLRIRCANVGHGHPALRASSSDQITLITPGTTEQFGAPLADLVSLPTSGSKIDRLRLTATVLAHQGDIVFLRSDQGPALRASFLGPLRGLDGQILPLELVPPPVPEIFQPGDKLELVGSPLKVTPFVHMSWCSFRKISSGQLPPALPVGNGDATTAACNLVSLKGRVIWHESAPPTGGMEKFAMDCGTTIYAEVPAATEADSHNPDTVDIQKDDLLEATGVLLPAEYGRPLKLQIADRQGLRRLSVTNPNRRAISPTAWRWIIGLTTGLAVALAGSWWLQRQFRQRTAALAVVNATLREEVAVREKAQSDLALALNHERELGELKSRFVTMVSHEFRTPLGIIMSAIELLRNYHERLSAEKRTELYHDIFSSTRHMAGLMEQMLVLGRVDAGTVSCKLAPCDLEILASKLTDECLSATNRKCIITWTADGPLRNAQADEALLRHIFSNLIHNAVKYSTDAGEVQFKMRREGDVAVFQVIDHGIGIPEEDQKHLFEAFQRGSNVGDIPGTGLGLVIVKRCVDLHGGTLHIESAVGQGTTFTVNLPLFIGT